MPLGRLKRPVRGQRFAETVLHRLFASGWAGILPARAGPGHAGRDPGFERGDLFVGEFCVRRHGEVVDMLHGGEEFALAAVAGHDDRPGIAAQEKCLAAVEPQARLAHAGPAALLAFGDQERPHLRFEERLGITRTSFRRGCGQGESQATHE